MRTPDRWIPRQIRVRASAPGRIRTCDLSLRRRPNERWRQAYCAALQRGFRTVLAYPARSPKCRRIGGDPGGYLALVPIRGGGRDDRGRAVADERRGSEAVLKFRTKAVPGRVVERSKRSVRNFDPNYMLILIGGEPAAVSDYRGCSLDSARARVLVTINACHGRRVTVTTATTGKRRVRRPARAVATHVATRARSWSSRARGGTL
jgi:hypothetical protein